VQYGICALRHLCTTASVLRRRCYGICERTRLAGTSRLCHGCVAGFHLISLFIQKPTRMGDLNARTLAYRLGDVVWFGMKGRAWEELLKGTIAHYPGSIAARYADAFAQRRPTPPPAECLQFVADLVDNFDHELRPGPDELAVHLRLGDVIEKSMHSVSRHLETALQAGPKGTRVEVIGGNSISPQVYIQPLSYFESAYKRYEGEGVARVALVCGGLRPYGVKSEEYVARVAEWWSSKGAPVTIRAPREGGAAREHERADADFVYLCRAKHFLPGGGGYSTLVSSVRPLMKERKEAGPQGRV
jgi:hypothetical protein